VLPSCCVVLHVLWSCTAGGPAQPLQGGSPAQPLQGGSPDWSPAAAADQGDKVAVGSHTGLHCCTAAGSWPRVLCSCCCCWFRHNLPITSVTTFSHQVCLCSCSGREPGPTTPNLVCVLLLSPSPVHRRLRCCCDSTAAKTGPCWLQTGSHRASTASPCHKVGGCASATLLVPSCQRRVIAIREIL